MTLTSTIEEQRRLRIRLAVAAYAYEYLDEEIMDDATFDRLCGLVDTSIKTGNVKLDRYFKKNFQPDTGMWVRKHPEKHKLEYIAKMLLKETDNEQ